MLALTRAVPPSIANCELTHLERCPIDHAIAAAQHTVYEDALRALGCRVERVGAAPDLPDSVFIEDTALVLDEVGILMLPGAASRHGELPGVAAALSQYRPLRFITPPATIDGGDILRVGRRLFVGRSTRTNQHAVDQLQSIAAPYGYSVTSVTVAGCLHLKSAVTAASEDLLVLDPASIDGAILGALQWIETDPSEPFGANVLRVGETCLVPASAPRTQQRLEQRGIFTLPVDASELAKAEGALTCCSLLVANS